MQGRTVVLSHPRSDTVGCTSENNAQQTAMSPTAVCTGLCSFLIDLTCSTVSTSIYGTSIISSPLRCLTCPRMTRNGPYIFISGFLKIQTDVIFGSIFRTVISFMCFRQLLLFSKEWSLEKNPASCCWQGSLVLQHPSSPARCRRHGPVLRRQA